jgi:hypothetical protein
VSYFFQKKFGKIKSLPLSLQKNSKGEFTKSNKNQSKMFNSIKIQNPIALDARKMLWAQFSE